MYQGSHGQTSVSTFHGFGYFKILTQPNRTTYIHSILTPSTRHLHGFPIRIIPIQLVPFAFSLVLGCLIHEFQSLFIQYQTREFLQMFLTHPTFNGRASQTGYQHALWYFCLGIRLLSIKISQGCPVHDFRRHSRMPYRITGYFFCQCFFYILSRHLVMTNHVIVRYVDFREHLCQAMNRCFLIGLSGT